MYFLARQTYCMKADITSYSSNQIFDITYISYLFTENAQIPSPYALKSIAASLTLPRAHSTTHTAAFNILPTLHFVNTYMLESTFKALRLLSITYQVALKTQLITLRTIEKILFHSPSSDNQCTALLARFTLSIHTLENLNVNLTLQLH